MPLIGNANKFHHQPRTPKETRRIPRFLNLVVTGWNLDDDSSDSNIDVESVLQAEVELPAPLDQIRHPKLIIGDFNAHHPLWNENTNQRQTNTTGTNITKWLSQNNVLLLTPRNLITRIDPKTAKESTLDLNGQYRNKICTKPQNIRSNFRCTKTKVEKPYKLYKSRNIIQNKSHEKASSFKWGANRETLIKFYKIYIKPKIEYGITIYGAAKEGEIKKIEILQNQVLRLATGCLNSTPIIALQALTNLAPMKDRKKELEYIHLTKILNKPNRMPIKQQTINYIKNYNPQRDKRSLFHRVTETNKILNIELKINEVPTTSPVPPWFDISNYIQINFAEELTKNTPQVVIQKYYQEMININYKDYTKIFTDGSKIKEPESTSAAIFIQDKEITTIWKLPANIEITHAELYAIKQGLNYIINNNLNKTVILTDSQSSLQLLQNRKPLNYIQIIYDIQKQMHTIEIKKQTIKIQWIPSQKH
nr:uncharacterized protein LOC113804734 [Penaeus vannamei]